MWCQAKVASPKYARPDVSNEPLTQKLSSPTPNPLSQNFFPAELKRHFLLVDTGFLVVIFQRFSGPEDIIAVFAFIRQSCHMCFNMALHISLVSHCPPAN